MLSWRTRRNRSLRQRKRNTHQFWFAYTRIASRPLVYSGAAIPLGYLLVVLVWDCYVGWLQSLNPAVDPETQLLIQVVMQSCFFVGTFFSAAVRRPRTGRL